MIEFIKGNPAEVMLNSPKRYFIFMGGRGAMRSFTASTVATAWLLNNTGERVLVTRQFEKDVSISIYQECIDRINYIEPTLKQANIWDKITISNDEIAYNTSSIRGFGFQSNTKKTTTKTKSLASISKVIMEECNDNSYIDFIQLDNTVRKSNAKIVLLCNPPPVDHWLIRTFFDLEPVNTPHTSNTFYKPRLKDGWHKDVDFIFSDYKSNPHLIQEVKDKYENYGNPNHPSFNPDYYYNQILGYVPAIKQGIIYKEYQKVDNINWNEYKVSCGLDFGYNDPTALIKIGYKDVDGKTEVVAEELLYKTHLSSHLIVKKILEIIELGKIEKDDKIYCDSSRPEIISELKNAGINAIPTIKGAGSVIEGINRVLNCKLKIKSSSLNLVEEISNYCWKNGAKKDEPEDGKDHAMDALRYASLDMVRYKPKTREEIKDIIQKSKLEIINRHNKIT